MSEPQASERRADERLPCNMPGYFLADEAGPLDCFWWRCQVRDVSAQGCRLIMHGAACGLGRH